MGEPTSESNVRCERAEERTMTEGEEEVKGLSGSTGEAPAQT